MKKTTKTATVQIAYFTKTASGWFVQNGNPNTNLPNELRVEQTARPDINARYVIRARSTERQSSFFTGILLFAPGIWYGNIQRIVNRKTTRSLLVLNVSGDGLNITAHLFPGYMPKQRAAFMRKYLKTVGYGGN